jgi:ubiquitin carboxyl-terminal hydrolase 9/13
MTSFFGRFKPGTVSTATSPCACVVSQWLTANAIQTPASPASKDAIAKKDPNAPQPTPLEKLLADAGPIRGDGSDKFFGFENVSALLPACPRLRPLIASLPNSLEAHGMHLLSTARERERLLTYSPPAIATPSYNVYTTLYPFGNRSSTSHSDPRPRRSRDRQRQHNFASTPIYHLYQMARPLRYLQRGGTRCRVLLLPSHHGNPR